MVVVLACKNVAILHAVCGSKIHSALHAIEETLGAEQKKSPFFLGTYSRYSG
jgi:hypothetical protein